MNATLILDSDPSHPKRVKIIEGEEGGTLKVEIIGSDGDEVEVLQKISKLTCDEFIRLHNFGRFPEKYERERYAQNERVREAFSCHLRTDREVKSAVKKDVTWDGVVINMPEYLAGISLDEWRAFFLRCWRKNRELYDTCLEDL
jgi:hypothetical protein